MIPSIARARYALEWRPRFLALLSLSRSTPLAARGAKVSPQVVWYQRRNDLDFEEQCRAAEEHATQLIHDACFKSVVEGDLEPIYWQGIQVGHVRKFDSRLRVEFLRAYMPERFKTPGVNVNVAARGDVFLLTEEQRHELRAINRAWLLDPSTVPASPSETVTPQPERLHKERNEFGCDTIALGQWQGGEGGRGAPGPARAERRATCTRSASPAHGGAW